MCGRFSIIADKEDITDRFKAEFPEKWEANYNAAPTQMLPVILDEQPGKIQLLRWGLIPSWAKDEKIGYKMINARAETVATKPAYKNCFERQRCLVIADSFYEWKAKQPHRIMIQGRGLFAMAGLWSRWQDKGREIRTFTIVTTEANRLVGKIHDRMPVILERKDEKRWLANADASLLRPYQGEMEQYRVSDRLNSATNTGPELIKEI